MIPEEENEDLDALSAFLTARDNVSDEELIARMNAAPDMGGTFIQEALEREATFMLQRYDISDQELRDRAQNAPDMGGAMYVELTHEKDMSSD